MCHPVILVRLEALANSSAYQGEGGGACPRAAGKEGGRVPVVGISGRRFPPIYKPPLRINLLRRAQV
ncbi:hypothetical protein AMELA_G00015920 [Ameiurus melas]|uniref:Uncharacterized protein n=1 Tax=Ameiurus melas TaxID=219545 RepID=A0A7J6BBZ0_AMEME|nr:hypothetical protein AMELA_G00015920 [Ameiurus melas]